MPYALPLFDAARHAFHLLISIVYLMLPLILLLISPCRLFSCRYALLRAPLLLFYTMPMRNITRRYDCAIAAHATVAAATRHLFMPRRHAAD